MKKITKIGVNEPMIQKKKLKVAAYCRVSTASDEQLISLDAQKAHYESYIRSNDDWEYVGLYYDAPVIIGLKQNPTQTGAALVLFSLFMGIFETFR